MESTKESNSVGVEEIAIFSIVIGLLIYKFVYPYFLQFQITLNDAYNSIQILIPIILQSWKFRIISAIIIVPILLYINYSINVRFARWRENIRWTKEMHRRDRQEVVSLMTLVLHNLSSNRLREVKERIKDIIDQKIYPKYKKELLSKINEVNAEMKVALRREELNRIKEEKEEARSEMYRLEEEIRRKEMQKREYEETSLRKLNASNTPVFMESDLIEKDKDLLKKHEYKSANEWCVFEKRNIRTFVKPPMHHSIKHTFLVWSAMRYLKTIKGVHDIWDWDTKEADITFKYNKQTFAIEIETGTLLGKKVQMRNKYDYLTSKYKDRHLTLVSKKSLTSKYAKYGTVTTRADFQKKVKKMLKNA